jgi:hypothetical protein
VAPKPQLPTACATEVVFDLGVLVLVVIEVPVVIEG